jgi:hypothetical protein
MLWIMDGPEKGKEIEFRINSEELKSAIPNP